MTEATIEYLSAAGRGRGRGGEAVRQLGRIAEGPGFRRFLPRARSPRIIAELKARHPGLPVIAFPREAGERYVGFARGHRAPIAWRWTIRSAAEWAAEHVQIDGCVQGNLDPGADGHRRRSGWWTRSRRIREAFAGGPHVFNLGHGITPDADPENVALMIETLREG